MTAENSKSGSQNSRLENEAANEDKELYQTRKETESTSQQRERKLDRRLEEKNISLRAKQHTKKQLTSEKKNINFL